MAGLYQALRPLHKLSGYFKAQSTDKQMCDQDGSRGRLTCQGCRQQPVINLGEEEIISPAYAIGNFDEEKQ
jgi:hypothetical protein